MKRNSSHLISGTQASNLALSTTHVATAIRKSIKISIVALSMLTGLFLTGCASFNRSNASGYADRNGELGIGQDRRLYEKERAASELGYGDGQELDDEQAESVALRIELRKAEKLLEGRREIEQYYKNKPYMRNDRERLAFLRIDTFEDRARWLAARGISGTSTPHPAEIQALIDVNDITTGMTKQAVRDAWGEPELVEVAGKEVYGNERWHYREQISSAEGYQTESRIVYFESGHVVGWEKN